MKTKSFVIDRSKWRCGGDKRPHARGVGDTELLNEEGFMCCLGQVSQQLGCSERDLLGMTEPASAQQPKKLAGVLLDEGGFQNSLTYKAISINDCPSYTTKKRESELKKAFKSFGFHLRFFGRYVKPKVSSER